VGRAVTTALAEGPAPAGGAHLGARAIETAESGDVIVIDNNGRTEMGAWGGLLSVAARRKGVGGIVVDGACRDVDEAREMGLAVFGRAGVCRTARGRVHEASVGEPVSLCGVLVHPGDVIVADASGIVVVPATRLDDVLTQAERIAAREAAMVRRLRDGEQPSLVLGAKYEEMLHDAARPIS
jgi:regulator of RNase E activity RraA